MGGVLSRTFTVRHRTHALPAAPGPRSTAKLRAGTPARDGGGAARWIDGWPWGELPFMKCIHTYVHTYIHTYIHTYVHTYIYIYIIQFPQRNVAFAKKWCVICSRKKTSNKRLLRHLCRNHTANVGVLPYRGKLFNHTTTYKNACQDNDI